MKIFGKILGVITVILIIYLLGPHPGSANYSKNIPTVTNDLKQLDSVVVAHEAKFKIKPNNEARIVWLNDSTKEKTEYSIVYLHGFSASQEEGEPIHRKIAKAFGCNLYLSRLAEHGIDTSEALVGLTAENYYNSALEALAIGRQLGEKVILMGTSTGGTLALKLAADFPDIVAGLVLYSPNIAVNDPYAWMLNDPWGLQIARLVKGSKYFDTHHTDSFYTKYWNTKYRLEGTVALEELVETTMNNNTFRSVKQPVLVMYYYKDEQHQDKVVKVSAIKQMFENLGTVKDAKKMIPVPNAGNHVIACYIESGDIITPQKETEKFLKEIMGIQEVSPLQ